MFDLWKLRPLVRPQLELRTEVRDCDQKSAEASAERRRLADTDGKRRRMRQQVENNRLL